MAKEDKRPENIKPHQWKKGQSGNPSGRPKGSKNFKTLLREIMEVDLPENDVIVKALKGQFPNHFGPDDKTNFQKVILMKLVAGTLDKNPDTSLRYIRELLDRAEGRATTKTEITGADGGPIQTEGKQVYDLGDGIKIEF